MRSLLLCLLAACAQASFVTNTLLPRAQTSQRTAVSAITMAQPKGVVITGGAGGVGWAYADEFMRQGHWVVICDVKDPEPAVEALRALHPDGISRVHGITCDVSDAASVQKLVEFSQEKLGTIHYWINNAGINGGRRPFTSVPLGVVEAVVKVNLMGLLLCTHAAMTAMQQQKGVKSHVCRASPVPCARRGWSAAAPIAVTALPPLLRRRSSRPWARVSRAAERPATRPTAPPSVACPSSLTRSSRS